MPLWFTTVLQLTFLAYALIGGVFLAFSDFIMRSLALSGQGAETMQVINREVFRWIFMTLFLGLAPASLALAIYGVAGIGGGVGTLIAIAGLCYIFGCFGVTVIFNVPMNNALEALAPETADLTSYWEGTYLPRWTFWNSVRTAACVVAAAILAAAITWSMHAPASEIQ